jgi:DMSO/TMAO reductase YedYZ molybdopterin-dependent catalytic subunit
MNTSRRFFLKAAGVLGFLACLPRNLLAFFIKRLEVRTVEKEVFRFDQATGTVRWSDRNAAEPYRLIVDGLAERPMSFTYKDLASLPRTDQTSDFHCVEGWSVKDIRWGGFRFDEIAKRVKPKPQARYAVFHALGKTTSRPGGLDHYVESISLAQLLDPGRQCLLAMTMNGKPLTHEHGAPLRAIIPFDLGYKGAKYVARITFSHDAQPGWWTLANPIYPAEASVPKDRLRKKT